MAPRFRLRELTSWAILTPVVAFLMLCGLSNGFDDLPRSNTDSPIEKGDVQWTADLQAATQKSKATGRPIFLLFQEIPG